MTPVLRHGPALLPSVARLNGTPLRMTLSSPAAAAAARWTPSMNQRMFSIAAGRRFIPPEIGSSFYSDQNSQQHRRMFFTLTPRVAAPVVTELPTRISSTSTIEWTRRNNRNKMGAEWSAMGDTEWNGRYRVESKETIAFSKGKKLKKLGPVQLTYREPVCAETRFRGCGEEKPPAVTSLGTFTKVYRKDPSCRLPQEERGGPEGSRDYPNGGVNNGGVKLRPTCCYIAKFELRSEKEKGIAEIRERQRRLLGLNRWYDAENAVDAVGDNKRSTDRFLMSALIDHKTGLNESCFEVSFGTKTYRNFTDLSEWHWVAKGHSQGNFDWDAGRDPLIGDADFTVFLSSKHTTHLSSNGACNSFESQPRWLRSSKGATLVSSFRKNLNKMMEIFRRPYKSTNHRPLDLYLEGTDDFGITTAYVKCEDNLESGIAGMGEDDLLEDCSTGDLKGSGIYEKAGSDDRAES